MQLTKLVWAFGMGAAVLAGQAQASDQGHGTVKFTGSIIDAPCSITGAYFYPQYATDS